MVDTVSKESDWVLRGKAIRQLIAELQTFGDQDLMVELSLDGGATHYPISLVKKVGNKCLLVNSEPVTDEVPQ